MRMGWCHLAAPWSEVTGAAIAFSLTWIGLVS
jgi:hypothetical protein